tara:strand:+ start:15913 stop:16641 length:729 start_codon:yes stop_codon:yes gene_type:complete
MKRKAARVEREPNLVDLEEGWKDAFFLDFKIKKPFYLNHNHKELYASIRSSTTNMVLVDGPAGTAKTYIAVYSALEELKEEKAERIIYIRSVIESAAKSLGSLPGEVDDKFLPYAMPLIEKVREIAGDSACGILKQRGLIEAIPVNFVRGLTFSDSIVIVDEAQNLTKSELATILTRFGRRSKYIVCGDTHQSDINKSGFSEVFQQFSTVDCADNNIYAFRFGRSEIVRSKILRFICKVLGT